jgi:PKD repeat protein
VISGATSATLSWTAPVQSGIYAIKCEVTSNNKTLTSNEIQITVAPEGEVAPQISSLTLSGNEPYALSSQVEVTAAATPPTAAYNWQFDGGQLLNANSLTPTWILPDAPGLYTLSLTVSNLLGSVSASKAILVKDLASTSSGILPLIYYPFNGNTTNVAQNGFDAVNHGAVSSPDQRGNANNAYGFASSSQYIATPNAPELNFTGQLSVSLWLKPDILPNYEQFVISHGSYEERYKMSVTPEKKLRWTLKTSNGVADVDDPTALKTGEFVHYTGVYTGYSLELYRNGVFVAYKALNGTIGTSSKSITLARKDESETNYTLQGTIDEVRIYDQALPAGFIQTLPSLWQLTSGIRQEEAETGISVWPNPFADHFSISMKDPDEAFSLEILNMQGQKIWSKDNLTNGEIITPDVSMPKGVYLLKVKGKFGRIVSTKLIKI